MSSFENGIIRWLTAIFWLIDVRFGKNTLWCVKKVYSVVPTFLYFLCVPVAQFFQGNTREALFELIYIGPLYFLISTLLWKIDREYGEDDKMILRNLESSPNPNKETGVILIRKKVSQFFILGSPILLWYTSTQFFYLATCVLIGQLLTTYAVCVDKIPPTEKQRRIEKVQEPKMNLSPT